MDHLRDRAVNPFDDMGEVDEEIFGGFEEEEVAQPEVQIVEVAQKPSPTGVIQIGKFLTTPRGIEDVEGEPSYDEWLDVMKWLRSTDDSKQWILGDMARIGAEHLARWLGVEALNEEDFKSAYEQIIAATGYSYSYVTKLASVSRIYPFRKRLKNTQHLTYSHYLQLIDIDDEKQREQWLDIAERNGWSVRDLYRAAHAGNGDKPKKPLTPKQRSNRFEQKFNGFKAQITPLLAGASVEDRREWAARLRAVADEIERNW